MANQEPKKMVTITFNGQQLQVEEDSYILDAAKKLGVWIPTLCHNPILESAAECRVCSVEVKDGKGWSKIVTACNYPCWDGMIVETNNERVKTDRETILKLLLERWPAVPAIREIAEKSEMELPEIKAEDDDKACILCGMCVRACQDVVGAHAIGFYNRGKDRKVGTPFDEETDACILCGACAFVCPTGHIQIEEAGIVVHSEVSLAPQKSIRVPFLQAVPKVPFIDAETCIHFKTGECRTCEKVCQPGAIRYQQEPTYEEINVGNIIVATGFKVFDPTQAQQFGYGKLPNVITSLEFERMSNAGGASGGKIVMRNGKKPKSVAILHCIGSRDKSYNEHCSRVCCMYSLKMAHLIKDKIGAEVYNLYIDMRCYGKGYEEFYNRLLHEDIRFIRGKAAEVTDFPLYAEEEGKLVVRVEDTLIGEVRRIPVDMVILSVGLEAATGAQEVARMFNISRSRDGFFLERHPKLAPVSTPSDGIYLAGACQGPKDIPDTVAQGLAAAANVLSIIAKGVVELEPIVANIDPDVCTGCKSCLKVCPYDAISYNEEKKISQVQEALCKGCGTCVATCPSGAAKQWGFDDLQIFAEIVGVLADETVKKELKGAVA